jgi:DNA-binding transcriptional LysR family regulator
VDLEVVRTFTAVHRAGQFSEAAADLFISQQAVSRRIAALETELGVRLFTRHPDGVRLTPAGQRFLAPANELLHAAERAAASVQPGRRPLEIDVIARRSGPGMLLRRFHREHPEVELDVAAYFDIGSAIDAVRYGSTDASFRAIDLSARHLPDDLQAARVLDEPLQLLTGPRHPLAGAVCVTPAELAGHRIWIPGIVQGTEWAAYYADLTAQFGLSIDAAGPNFGSDDMLDTIAGSDSVATLFGADTRLNSPASDDLRRIPLCDPTPVYPHSLIWQARNDHPGLAVLRAFLQSGYASRPSRPTWTPGWARPLAPAGLNAAGGRAAGLATGHECDPGH